MTRSNRYILPGYIYHLTHRCHNRKFLLKCRLDRTEYNSRLRDAVRNHHISLLDFTIISNHVHLAVGIGSDHNKLLLKLGIASLEG